MPPPITIPFGPFEPDAADLNAGVLSVASNVCPSKVGYSPFPQEVVLGSTNLYANPRGAALIQTSTTGAYSLYAGDSTTLSRIDSSALATIRGLNGGLTGPNSGEYWRFAKFGNYLIITNPNTAPRVTDWTSAIGAATTAALGGSPPTATGVFTITDHVFLTGLSTNKRSLQWSALNDHTGWTAGTNLSDTQEFPDGGDIQGIAGGESGYVIQQNAIRSYQRLPGDITTIFSFSKLEGIPGCVSSYAWASAAQTIFYYSEEGFCSIGPAGFNRIGAHRVDIWFKAKGITNTLIFAVSDPYNSRIYFYYGTGTLIYDYALDRWSDSAMSSALVDHIDGTGAGAQCTIAGATTKLSQLSGTALAATLTTGVFDLYQNTPAASQSALITAMRPLVNGAVTSVSTTASRTLTGSTTTTSSTTQETNGTYSLRAGGAYHKLSVVTTLANAATYHKGIQVWAQPDGEA